MIRSALPPLSAPYHPHIMQMGQHDRTLPRHHRSVVLVSSCLPQNFGVATNSVSLGILKYLHKSFDSIYFVYCAPHEDVITAQSQYKSLLSHIPELEDIFFVTASPVKGFFDKTPLRHIPVLSNYTFNNISQVRNVVFDAAYAFDYPSIHLLSYLQASSLYAIQPDPAGARIMATSHTIPKYLIGLALTILEPVITSFLLPKHKILIFGCRHARHWSQLTFRQVLSIRPILSINTSLKSSKSRLGPYTLSFGGTLSGTASRSVLKILNPICTQLSTLNSSYQLHISGHPLAFQDDNKLISSLITFTGYQESLEDYLSDYLFFIFPSPYWVGVRTRVASALASGCICILHQSLLINMPELGSIQSCFFFRSPEEFTSILADLSLRSNDYDTLIQCSVSAYTTYYSPSGDHSPFLCQS